MSGDIGALCWARLWPYISASGWKGGGVRIKMGVDDDDYSRGV